MLLNRDVVEVRRGLQTLKNASFARSYGNIEYLNTVTLVNVHRNCRKNYTNNFGTNTVDFFDGCSDTSKNIKAMEQLRRTAAVSISCEVHFNESMEVPISQEKCSSNRFNKRKLIEMLIEKFEEVGIATRQSRDLNS